MKLMMKMKNWKDVCDVLIGKLRLQTDPVAVKYFKSFDDLTRNELQRMKFRRPREPLAVCQIVTLARMQGWSFYFTSEDMACVIGSSALGLCEMNIDTVASVIARKTRELSRKFLEEIPKIPSGEVKAVACAPLKSVPFDPDQILIYCVPAQALRIFAACIQETTYSPSFKYGAEVGLCAEVMARSYITKEMSFTMPCFGERTSCFTGDDEVIIGIPNNLMDSFLDGLKRTEFSCPYPIPKGIFGGIHETPRFPREMLTEYAKRKQL
jgi:uncharacterized protein (DUF169 family)